MLQIPSRDARELMDKLGVKFESSSELGSPYRQITQDEFVRSLILTNHRLEAVCFNQIYVPPYGRKEGRWDAHYYIYPNKVIATVDKYLTRQLWDGNGIFIPFDPKEREWYGQWGYQTLFFQVGCEHKNLKREALQYLMKRVTCLDCGWVNEFSTDG